jgi:hypothetical protein
MNLCKYKNILGIPGKGLHSYRILNIPIFDVLLTFIGALIINYLFFKNKHYWCSLILLFIIGIILHKIFCVKTPIDKFIFG